MTGNKNFCIFLPINIFVGFALSQNCNPPTNTTELFPYPSTSPGNFTTCGAVLTQAPYGGIFYKPHEFVGSNERCIWTIFFPKGTGFNVIIHQFGYTPVGNDTEEFNGIILSSFGRGRAPEHVVPRTTDPISLINSNILIVTYYTGTTNENFKGFILQYTILFNGSEPHVSPRSRHLISEPNRYYLKHPVSSYSEAFEISTFVFLPKDCLYTQSSTKHNALIIVEDVLHSNQCRDNIKLYKFSGSSPCNGEYRWQFLGRICGRISDSTHIIPTEGEPILAVLEATSGRNSFRFIYA